MSQTEDQVILQMTASQVKQIETWLLEQPTKLGMPVIEFLKGCLIPQDKEQEEAKDNVIEMEATEA